MFLTVNPVNVNGLVVFRLERLAAVLACVLTPLNVASLHVVREGLVARPRLVADGTERLVCDPVKLDELPDLVAVVRAVDESGWIILAFLN